MLNVITKVRQVEVLSDLSPEQKNMITFFVLAKTCVMVSIFTLFGSFACLAIIPITALCISLSMGFVVCIIVTGIVESLQNTYFTKEKV